MTTLYEILHTVKPKRALFTSYTFSSAWFEASPYPLLRRNDCEQITVMLDAREARRSIDNSISRFGGNRYRVVSTIPAGEGAGIFHPKIAYLESDQGDVFVVGSANLTVRGQGRALEVIDVVSASSQPLLFGQIAEFFELLPGRLSMLGECDREMLAGFAKRARAQMAKYAGNASDVQSVWLVTTLLESAASQFSALASQVLSPPRKLTVLSPFFDRDVGAIARLREKLDVNEVRYGLARTKDELIAPFLEDIERANKPSHFVEPPDNGRPLHAKWFELTGEAGDALVMTGSVNATRQSLWKINNIEVSLVRHLPQTSVGDWHGTSERPRYVPCEFPAPLSAADEITFVARITRQHLLEVQFSRVAVCRKVKLVLHYADRHFEPQYTVIDDDNVATVQVGERFVQELPDEALWLTASGEEIEGTTWVNVEPHLDAKPAQVDLFKSLARVEHDAYDDEDVYLLFNAGHQLLTRCRLRNNGKTSGKAVADEERHADALVSEAEWLAGQGAGTRRNDPPSSEAIRIFQAIGKLLEMRDADIEAALAPIEDDEPENTAVDMDEVDGDPAAGDASSKETRKLARQRLQRRQSLAHARAAFQVAIDQRLARPPLLDALAILIIPQKIRNSLREGMPLCLKEVDEGRANPSGPVPQQPCSYLIGLFTTLMSLRLGTVAVDNLLPMIMSAAALTAVCLQRRGMTVPYDQLCSALEVIAGRPLSEADCEALLATEWRDGRLPRMRRFEMADLVAQAGRIVGAPRLEDRIENVLAVALDDMKKRVPDDMHDVAYVVDALRQPTGRNWRLYSVLVADEISAHVGCPQCHAKLDAEEFRKLKRVRMAVCKERCKRALFLKMGVADGHQFKRQSEACIRDIRPRGNGNGEAR